MPEYDDSGDDFDAYVDMTPESFREGKLGINFSYEIFFKNFNGAKPPSQSAQYNFFMENKEDSTQFLPYNMVITNDGLIIWTGNSPLIDEVHPIETVIICRVKLDNFNDIYSSAPFYLKININDPQLENANNI